jgi:hypothetical protein
MLRTLRRVPRITPHGTLASAQGSERSQHPLPLEVAVFRRKHVANFRFSRIVTLFGAAALLLGWAACTGNRRAQRIGAQRAELRPVDGAAAIIEALDRHQIVALGDLHGCEEFYQFIDRLLRRPDLADRVNDIVVEFGNALFQDVADRYTSGREVSPEELSKIWRDHTNPIVFDSRVYEHFLTTIREVNGTLPEAKRFRVHLGDPPIDWLKTTTNREWGRMLFQRDAHFASIVEKVSYASGRRALLIIGGAHLVRGPANNVTGRIESLHPGSMFIVIPHDGFRERNSELEPALTKWKPGTLALLRQTWLGALPPRYRWPQMRDSTFTLRGGQVIEARLENMADAWLYLAPRDLLTEAMPFPGIYRDDYWNELRRRHMIMWGTPLDASSGDINTSARYYVPQQ